ncbi:hypothetical protein [Pseudomonas sp. BN411]|uniref:hypothetical protein n=1 Tax=Pseudomonas sp. BN411 TaxID=2567887 RepID=UPI0024572F67|nr:hypothetical protein [Pseudomonas sp. BN411]MDH4562840.1 hypothetical protein [Pseudomonas sp. BN411]
MDIETFRAAQNGLESRGRATYAGMRPWFLGGRRQEKAGDILFVLLKVLKRKGKNILDVRPLIAVSTGPQAQKTAFPGAF